MQLYAMRALLVGVVCLTAIPRAHAAGFAISQQGASAEGVAGAATARDDLSEVTWFNPAATPAGVVGAIGTSVIFPAVQHADPSSDVTTRTESGPATPPWVHVGYVHDAGRHRFGGFVIGSVPFGASLQWPQNWDGRYEVTAVSLRVYETSVNAVYGLEVTDGLEFGAAAQFRAMRGTFTLDRRIDAVESEGTVMLGGAGSTTAFGGSVFGKYRGISLGANLRSGGRLPIDGNAHFEDVPVELSGPAHDQTFTTTFPLPARLAVGAAWDLGFGTPSVDVEMHRWSTFQTFEIDFADEETPDVTQARSYQDTAAFRVGYEHRLLNRQLALRAGFAYDRAPTPTSTLSPSSPDVSRAIGTIGVGYALEMGLRMDAAFGHMTLLSTTATGSETFPGRYRGAAEVFSIGLSWRR